jgi:hydroxyacylglutathione hydrolase
MALILWHRIFAKNKFISAWQVHMIIFQDEAQRGNNMKALGEWTHGVWLLGRYDFFETGCWLLHHGGKAALLEAPPYNPAMQWSPAHEAQRIAAELGVTVEYLLCTHAHHDHFHRKTHSELAQAFPTAQTVLHEEFRSWLPHVSNIQYFTDAITLSLGGEPLHIVHAPKHSMSDSMVVFRGSVCTGDWELNTLKSAHDDKPRYSVPNPIKLKSVMKMTTFERDYHYRVKTVYSAHANDFRENIDFTWLMADTGIDRPLW